jgi:hypothetical protein
MIDGEPMGPLLNPVQTIPSIAGRFVARLEQAITNDLVSSS